jgi:hypothetical protein
VSGSPQRGAGNARPAAPAASETIVAVLERRGRFLVAEPLFPRRNAGAGAGRRDRSDRLTIKSPGSGRGGVRAAAGDLVLLSARDMAARRGSSASSGARTWRAT